MSVQIPQRYDPVFPIDDLLDHPDNPRLHDDAWLDESVEGTGFSGTVVAQESTKRILDGHGRRASLRRAGETTIPVMFIDVDDLLAKKILFARNPPKGTTGGYDDELLALGLGELAEMGELFGTGYDPDALDDILGGLPDLVELPVVEFEGGHVESPEELAKRMERVAVTQDSEGLREMVFVFKQEHYDMVQVALAAISNFHETTTNSETVVAALVNYARVIVQEAEA